MKKGYTLIALASMALALASCADDFGMNNAGKYTGREIVFGSRASYEINEMGGKQNAPATRTVYTEEILNGDGETWSEGDGTKYEGVHWIPGDKVRVYCAEAAGVQTFDYSVTVSENTTNNITGLDKGNSEASLQWGGDVEHTFYAVYPTENAELTYDASTKNTKLTGEIPNIQVHKGENYLETSTTDGVTSYTVAPDMKYAYMMAKTVAKPSKEGVILRFMPIVTAVEITIANLAKSTDYPDGTTFHLANVLVSSANNESIYGQFEADFANITSDANGYGTGFTDTTDDPAITIAGDAGTQISLPMYTDGLYGDPIALAHGASITFTVFLLPTQDLDAIKVTIQGIDGNKTATISGGTFKITKRKKTYLNNLPLAGGTVLPFTQDEWLKYVENDVPLYDLSIPGAGGAASGDMDENGTYDLADINRQQNLSINKLWDKGVRCFEFATDIYVMNDDQTANTTTVTTNLGDQYVICNGISTGVKLDDAITYVTEQLNEHHEEFAMVILTYQTLGGWSARKPATYMTLLNSYWPTVADKLTGDCELGLYDPSSQTGDCRGNLYCIARPTSIHQDYGDAVVTPESRWWGLGDMEYTPSPIDYTDLGMPSTVAKGIVVINGWGALKDKWQQRGYIEGSYRQYNVPDGSTKPGRPFDVSTLWNKSHILAHYNETKNTWNGGTWYGDLPSTSYVPGTLTPDFTYTTSLGDDKSAWVQEWARVSNLGNTNDDIFGVDQQECTTTAHSSHDEIKAIYWTNTYAEKVQNIQDALTYAIGKTKKDDGISIYINSLCGYFIDKTIEQSYIPCVLTDYNANNNNKTLSKASQTAGLQGDIQTFASTINQMFYDYLQDVTAKPNLGSMGIILMDRVGEIVGTNVGGDRIPGIIVANNFQHKTSAAALSLRRDNYEDGDVAAAPQRREASESKSEEISIVWE